MVHGMMEPRATQIAARSGSPKVTSVMHDHVDRVAGEHSYRNGTGENRRECSEWQEGHEKDYARSDHWRGADVGARVGVVDVVISLEQRNAMIDDAMHDVFGER